MPYRVNLPLALMLVRPEFDRAEQAKGVTVPMLVLHGSGDLVCPLADGEAIAAACPNGRLVVIEGGGHVDLYTEPEHTLRMERAVREFLQGLAGSRPETKGMA